MSDDKIAVMLLRSLLEGATFANALRRNGKPCRVPLPDGPVDRAAIIDAHLRGAPATLTFQAEAREPWKEQVEAVALAAFCPGADGLCRWIGIDIDGTDHGVTGLADPVHTARAIAERAADAGLLSGLLVARSRRGQGRHVFLLLPEPTALADAVVGVAALAAAAFRVAVADVAEYNAVHAFGRADGGIAYPGDSGAVELIPRSTAKPPHGWALALPGAGAFASHGGGVIVDPFTDRPTRHKSVPRCDHDAWHRFVKEARTALSTQSSSSIPLTLRRQRNYTVRLHYLLDRIDTRTRAFLDGRAQEGTRNGSAFAASLNLLGCGVEEHRAERLILAGAAACGLPQREALAAFRSAVKTLMQRHMHT